MRLSRRSERFLRGPPWGSRVPLWTRTGPRAWGSWRGTGIPSTPRRPAAQGTNTHVARLELMVPERATGMRGFDRAGDVNVASRGTSFFLVNPNGSQITGNNSYALAA